MSLSNLTDEELVKLYKDQGNLEAQEALIERYSNLAKKLAHSYFLCDGSTDDLVQVATIGILRAINSYNGTVPFKNFVYKVAQNAVYSEIKRSQSGKNRVMYNYISFSENTESQDKNLIIIDNSPSPEDKIIGKDLLEEIYSAMQKNLSKFEYNVLRHYITGKSYLEIASIMGKDDVKSIDNAIQRARKKLGSVINIENL